MTIEQLPIVGKTYALKDGPPCVCLRAVWQDSGDCRRQAIEVQTKSGVKAVIPLTNFANLWRPA